jgi:hypothetical protein
VTDPPCFRILMLCQIDRNPASTNRRPRYTFAPNLRTEKAARFQCPDFGAPLMVYGTAAGSDFRSFVWKNDSHNQRHCGTRRLSA